MSFIDDIQGQNTQLYPIVTIEPPDTETSGNEWTIDLARCILLSTNNVSLDHIHSEYDAYVPEYKGLYFQPLLLNIPSIKESIDIESRKFKISNVSLDISNIEYEGKRFTDILSDTSLINWKCSVQFVSPSANKFSTIFGLSDYYSSWYGNSMYDAWSGTGSHNFTFAGLEAGYHSKMTQMVYQGIIRRISHDDTKVRIELEDLTEKLAHKNLPSESLGNGEDVPDKYKNKPIPMVYGHVDRSPLVISDSNQKLSADSAPIKNFLDTDSGYTLAEENTEGEAVAISLDSLQVDIDGESFHVKKGVQYTYDEDGGSINFASGIVPLTPDDGIEDVTQSLICRRVATPRAVINNNKYDPDLINADWCDESSTMDNINAIFDGSLATNNIGLLGKRDRDYSDTVVGFGNNENELLSINLDVSPQHDTIDGNNKIIGFRINGYNLPKFLGFRFLKPNHIQGLHGSVGDVNISMSNNYEDVADDKFNVIWRDDCYHAEYIQEVFGFLNTDSLAGYNATTNWIPSDNGYDGSTAAIQLNYYSIDGTAIQNSPIDTPLICFYGGENNTLSIQFKTIGATLFEDGNTDRLIQYRMELTGHIDEIGLLVESQATKAFNKDFYANVEGRVNAFDDHPDASLRLGSYSELSSYSEQELLWLYIDNEVSYLTPENDYFGYNLGLGIGLDEFTTQEQGNIIYDNQDGDYNVIEGQGVGEAIWDVLISAGVVITGEAFIQNPIDIIYDLVRSELGHDAIDEDEYKEAKLAHADWKFGFTVNKKISSKKLIEDIAKSTKCFPKFKNDGTFGFNTIKDSYTVSDIVDDVEKGDYNTATEIKESEVISYSFKKTKPEQIYRKVTVAYNKDYAQDSYLKNLDVGGDFQNFSGNDYYGITDTKETALEFESPYIRSEEGYDWTAFYLRNFLLAQYKNDHLIFNLKLPLQYINLEIGDLVKFRDLFGSVKAYGIDYRIVQEPNLQEYYPLFIVTSTTKNLDSVSVECMQLHHLSYDAIDSAWEDGIGEGDTDGLFYFSGADTMDFIAPTVDDDGDIKEEEVELESTDLLRLKDTNLW